MEMFDIYISFVIPCYNVAEYLEKTIKSLENLNDAEDVEFLFVDDGSKDNTLQIIKDFAARDKRVRYISQQNQGVSAARNNVLALANGRYLFFLDGDDFLNANTVQVIRGKMDDADLLIPDITISRPTRTYIWRNHIPCGRYTVDFLYLTCRFFPTTPKLIYRTSIIKENTLSFNPQIKCGEVYDFTVSYLRYVKSIVVTDDAFYNYVIRESSATHRPKYDADKTVLLMLHHFNEMDAKVYPWVDSPAFAVTSFKLVTAFTYLKYIHLKQTSLEAVSVVMGVLSDSSFKKLVKKVAYGQNRLLKERFIAVYIHLMPSKLGFYLLAKLSRFLKL
ncbi:MAG: glycosyltransferase family 2 protein [Bacteroidaceae bacterium]|nr:glycosyltransferase family 2 protein [Bacteroidaceae bacterium]